MSKNIVRAIILLILLSCSILFTWLFFNCIRLYNVFDVEYSDLTYKELTFTKYVKKSAGKSGYMYGIYFAEYDDPFEVSSITFKKVNKEEIYNLNNGDVLQVYFCDSDSKHYTYEICDMKYGSKNLLLLSDFVKVNQNNQVIGMIVCPIMVLCCVFLLVVFIKLTKNIEIPFIEENGIHTNNLGKLKIQYIDKGNTVQIYNSPELCSLVINGKIVDFYYGLAANKFVLKGEIEVEERIITVEAKMGYLYMKLFVDGKLVGKKFMGLG